jgi:hypothetical protein
MEPKERSFGLWPQEHLLAPQTPGGLSHAMPAKDTRKANPLEHRLSTNVDDALHAAFLKRAEAVGLSDASYLRHLIALDVGAASAEDLKRRNLKRVGMDNLAHEVNQVGLHIRKVGVNVNQLAKQANAGMVPISRDEAVRMISELELAMSRAIAVMERALT